MARRLLVLTAALLCALASALGPDWLPHPDRLIRVTPRPGNTDGVVPIIMYHRLEEKEEYMVRSYANFRKDLDRLYRMGFRPVTLTEYAENRMDLPPGASPVVLTFDDGWADQFRMDSEGEIDLNCFVGIWKDFSEKRIGFPIKGTFFVLPRHAFNQRAHAKAKLALLHDWGSELGGHSWSHPALNRLTHAEAAAELGRSQALWQDRGWPCESLALPYGAPLPKGFNIRSFSYQGRRHGYRYVCLAGDRPAPAPTSSRFRPLRIPRINAYEGDRGITYWLNRISRGEVQPYVQP